MIRVRVHINDKEIIDIHAVRELPFLGVSKSHTYNVLITYGGPGMNHKHIGALKHKYSLGASRLSIRMLRMYYKYVEENTARL